MRLAVEQLESRLTPVTGVAGGYALTDQAPSTPDLTTLHSNPGAPVQIVLDWWGGARSMAGTVLSAFAPTVTTPAYGTSAQRYEVWQRTSEAYAPFNVDVTTAEPTVAPGMYHRVIVGGDLTWYDPQRRFGGVTFTSYGGLVDTPSFVASTLLGTPKNVGVATAHEAGHWFGLGHDGTATVAYYTGSAAGGVSWAPTMGNSYGADYSWWTDGSYAGANNPQDEVGRIAAVAGLRADDFGDDFKTAAALLSGTQTTGLIGSRTDVDAFTFRAGAGAVSVTYSPAALGSALYGHVSLYDAAGTLLATGTGARAITLTTAGSTTATYYVTVEGVGFSAGAYKSDYGSLGQWWLAADYPPVPPTPPALSVAPVAQAEGNSLTLMKFVATLPYVPLAPVTFEYLTADGTATAGSDYRAAVGAVTFFAGQTSRPVYVYVLGDKLPEPDEWFTLLVGGVPVRGTIVNDDGLFASLFLPPEEVKPSWL